MILCVCQDKKNGQTPLHNCLALYELFNFLINGVWLNPPSLTRRLVKSGCAPVEWLNLGAPQIIPPPPPVVIYE